MLAVTNGISPVSGGVVAISSELAAQHYGATGSTMYEVQLADSADSQTVHDRLDELVAGAEFPVNVFTAREFVDASSQSGDQILSLIAMVLLVIVVCTGIAMMNTMLASVLERRRDLAILRAVGAERKQVRRSVTTEAFAIGAAGGLVGAIAGAPFQWIAVKRITAITAFHVNYSFSLLTVLLAVIAAVCIVALGSFLPARRVGRLELQSVLND